MIASPNSGQLIIVPLTFDAWDGPKVAEGGFPNRALKRATPSRKDQGLKDELHRRLHQPRSGRAHDLSKRRTVDVAVYCGRPLKLGVVEDVESFEPKLQRPGLLQRHALEQSHIVIVDARAVEESALGVAGLSQRLQTEKAGIEIGLSVARIVIQIERA